MKRIFFSLPDFWFLSILLFGWGDSIGAMFSGSWHAVNIILGLCLLICTICLIRQLFTRKVVVSFIMGFVFLIVSLYFAFAVLSELTKFPNLTELKALEMMFGGGAVVIVSMVMSVLMIIRSALNSFQTEPSPQ